VATTYISALETKAKMDPRIASFNAFFANVRFSFSKFDLVEMRTFSAHRSSPRNYVAVIFPPKRDALDGWRLRLRPPPRPLASRSRSAHRQPQTLPAD